LYKRHEGSAKKTKDLAIDASGIDVSLLRYLRRTCLLCVEIGGVNSLLVAFQGYDIGRARATDTVENADSGG